MPELNLEPLFLLAQVDAPNQDEAIQTFGVGQSVDTGEILVGADYQGVRYLLVPMAAEENFEEDVQAAAVQLVKRHHAEKTYICARCPRNGLFAVFNKFCEAVIEQLFNTSEDPSISTINTLNQWRQLLENAPDPGQLSESKTIGLLAELLLLEEILENQDDRSLGVWTGPSGSQHDFRCGSTAIEVKATQKREGREISISSLAQLTPPAEAELYLAFYRFESAPNGDSISDVVERILHLGIAPQILLGELSRVGYTLDNDPLVPENNYLLTEHRVYHTQSDSFPKITPDSFKNDECPPGVLSLSYKIDLTNEPPNPLSEEDRAQLIRDCALS